MPVPNDQLRRAREIHASPEDATRPMSRTELSRLVNRELFGADAERMSHSAFNANYLGKLERGVIRWPLDDYRRALRTVLGANTDEELGFQRPDNRCRPRGIRIPGDAPRDAHPTRDAGSGPFADTGPFLSPVSEVTRQMYQVNPDPIDDHVPVSRRTFMVGGIGIAGISALGAAACLESSRQDLRLALADDRAQADAEEWRDIVHHHGHRLLVSPPEEHLEALQDDLTALRWAAQGRGRAVDAGTLRQSAAYLSAFSALCIGNLGDVPESLRWWCTAKNAAEQSGDPNTILLVRAWEIIRALYDRRPLPAVLDLIAEAEPFRAALPERARSGSAELLAAQAQTLSMLGRGPEAINALHQMVDVAEHLPDQVVRDRDSILGWPPAFALHATSFVHSYLGDFTAASAAQDRAVVDYPPNQRRAPVQLELQRAMCLVRSGEHAEGLRHARQVLSGLSTEHHNRPVADLAVRVLESVPAAPKPLPGVQEYRDFLRHHLRKRQHLLYF